MHQEECNSGQIHSATKIPNYNVNFLVFAVHIAKSFDTIIRNQIFLWGHVCGCLQACGFCLDTIVDLLLNTIDQSTL